MTDIIVKVMVEVLLVLACATKAIKQGKISKFILDNMPFSFDLSFLERFVKKLIGMSEIDDALRRLDKLTHEEGRMAAAQGLRTAAQGLRTAAQGLSATQGVDERVSTLGDGMNDAINAVLEGAHLLLVVDTIILSMARWREHQRRVTKCSKGRRRPSERFKR
jgi:hypothetical protein